MLLYQMVMLEQEEQSSINNVQLVTLLKEMTKEQPHQCLEELLEEELEVLDSNTVTQ